MRGAEELSDYHRVWDQGFPRALAYTDMIAWLDENGYVGEERAIAIKVMRWWDATWRRKKIEEIEFNRPLER